MINIKYMKKFDEIYNNFINEDESLDQWHDQKMKEEQSSSKHEFDTLKHPLKDETLKEVNRMLKLWVLEGEHQNGVDWWDQYPSVPDAIEDFIRTVEFKNPKI